MEIKERVLYYTEEGFLGKLIDNNKLREVKVKSVILTEDEVNKILVNLQVKKNISHLCISFYRDAIIINGHTYNICLSCGDFYKDDKLFYLSKQDLEELKSYLNIIKTSKECVWI